MIFRRRNSLLLILLWVFACCTLIWCKSGNWQYRSEIHISSFDLIYNWNIKLENVPVKVDDREEIIGLYQEVWDNVEYRDSLLVAQKYSRWMWINAFVEDNLDILYAQWLLLSDIQKTQIWFEKIWEKMNAVLVEYKITEWFIEEIPILYVSELFVPDWENVILLSFISENQSSSVAASNMFKNIK